MIFKREEYIEEIAQGPNVKFPVRHIEVFTPLDGGKPRFVGQVVLGVETPMGIQRLPISFEIQAEKVVDAFQRFDLLAEPKIEEARREIEDELLRMRREQSGRIITPGTAGGMGLGGIDLSKLKE